MPLSTLQGIHPGCWFYIIQSYSIFVQFCYFSFTMLRLSEMYSNNTTGVYEFPIEIFFKFYSSGTRT